MLCHHRTKHFDACDITIVNASVDRSKGSHQGLQEIFSADMQQNLPCTQPTCMSEDAVTEQDKVIKWPLSLMLFFQQQPVSLAAHHIPARMI